MIHVPERANLDRPQSAVIVLHAAANATILVAAVWADGPLWYFV